MTLELRRAVTALRLHVSLRWNAWRAHRHGDLEQTYRGRLRRDTDRVNWLAATTSSQ